MKRSLQAKTVPGITFPDNQTFIATDVDFSSFFPTSLGTFTALSRFSCTRCQLTSLPVSLYPYTQLETCELRENQIRELPVQLETFAIRTLDLTENEFTQVPPQVWAMPELRVLNMAGNKVSVCQSPDERPDLASRLNVVPLETLILDDNNISALTCEFPNLRTLSLRQTRMIDLLHGVGSFPQLTSLNLSENPRLTLQTNATMTLTNLRKLELAFNQLRTVPSSLVTLAPGLSTLNIMGNKLKDVAGLAPLTTLQSLEELVLDGNEFTNLTVITDRFPKVANLSVADNKLTECGTIRPAPFVLHLNLSHNEITRCTLNFPRLRTLDLSHNRIMTVPTGLFTLTDLQTLDMSGNAIEPWALSESQFTFLSKLSAFTIDQTAFASCPTDQQVNLHGKTVCVTAVDTPETLPPIVEATPTPVVTTGGSSTKQTQLLSLGGSFLIAVTIATFILCVRRRRARSAADAASTNPQGSNPSSPGGGSTRSKAFRRESSRRTPLKCFAEVNHSRSRSDHSEASAASRTSSRSLAPLPVPPSMNNREVTGQRAFWEDDRLQSWRVEYDGVTMQKRLAVGAFVEIWRASYRMDTVVVKKLKPSIRLLHHHHPDMVDISILDDFIFEIRMLSRLNHPRIVAFYGAAWTTDSDVMAVMECMPQQDLHGYLVHQRRRSEGSRSGYSDDVTWTIEMVHMVLCVAEALVCLHTLEPAVVHGNVQARNVLLDEHMDSKLCDFGSAQYCLPPGSFHESPSTNRTSGADTTDTTGSYLLSARADATAWIAPEVLRGRAACDPFMDLYSFGVLLAEIDTGEGPYANHRGEEGESVARDAMIRQQVAHGSLRPTFTQTCPASILGLATRCLAFEPSDRPTSADVACALREIIAEMERASGASKPSTFGTGSTVGPLRELPSTGSSVSDSNSDLSQRTIELKVRYKV